MQRCKFCATGVAADATRCWLCHAGVEPSTVEEGPDDLAFLPHPAHVWTGPLARAPMLHSDPDAVARTGFSRWWRRMAVRSDIRLLAMLLAMLAAALPYAATGSRATLLIFAAPFGLFGMWAVRHVGRRGRLARLGHSRGFAITSSR